MPHDHLVNFATEEDAQADPVIGQYWTPGNEEGPGTWNMSMCNPGQYVWTGTYEERVYFEGWFMTMTFNNVNATIRDSGACWVIGNPIEHELANTNVVWSADDLPPNFLTAALIEPVWQTR